MGKSTRNGPFSIAILNYQRLLEDIHIHNITTIAT
jgi:hypothetical protein